MKLIEKEVYCSMCKETVHLKISEKALKFIGVFYNSRDALIHLAHKIPAGRRYICYDADDGFPVFSSFNEGELNNFISELKNTEDTNDLCYSIAALDLHTDEVITTEGKDFLNQGKEYDDYIKEMIGSI